MHSPETLRQVIDMMWFYKPDNLRLLAQGCLSLTFPTLSRLTEVMAVVE